jgi:predicted site-specific integrase-resolvase
MNPKSVRVICDLETHDQPIVTARQVCLFLQIDKRTLRKFVDGGYLPGMQLPGAKREWRFRLADLRAFVAQQHVSR